MAKKFTRKRWRRPERMTLEHPQAVRRKGLSVPDLLRLEPALERRTARRRLTAMVATFVTVAVIEGVIVGVAIGRLWVAALPALVAIAYVGAAFAFGGTWIARAFKAERAKNPRVNRMSRNLAATAGVPAPSVLIVREEVPNAYAIGLHRRAVVTTTGSLNMDDLVVEGMIGQQIVQLRDGDATLSSAYVTLAGMHELLSRNVMVAPALVVWPAALVVRALRPLWFTPDFAHRADIAGAFLTRYPPGIATALRAGGGRAPKVPRTCTPFWFSANAEPRAGLVAEM
jgi:uncharacterized protein YneF (UPF0154 family)